MSVVHGCSLFVSERETRSENGIFEPTKQKLTLDTTEGATKIV